MPDFLSRFTAHGQVEIEGYGPASGATAQASCGSTGRADSQGRFVVAGTVGQKGNQSCTITVQATGCEPRSFPLVGPAGSVGLGTIVLQPVIGRAGAGMVSFSSLGAPEGAKKLRDQARKSASRKRLDLAQSELEKALAIHSRDAEAWLELGLIHKQRNDEANARAAFERSREADARFVPALVQLAVLALRREDWPGVVRHAGEAARINPVDFPEAWLYLATAHLKQSDAATAEKDARRAIERSKDSLPKAHHLLGVALAQQGRVPEAIAELRLYLDKAPGAADAATVRAHLKMLEVK